MMTRKDYEALATALGQNTAAYYNDPYWDVFYVIDIIAEALESNPNFDKYRFLKAILISRKEAEHQYSKLYGQ